MITDKTILQQCIEEAGYKPRSYSGRGMYGKECLAVYVDSGEMFTLIEKVLVAAYDLAANLKDLSEEIGKGRTDNMGLGYVFYFPGVEFYKEEEKENDSSTETR